MPIQQFLPGMGGGAGHKLGHAHGVISIDTSQVEHASAKIKRVGQNISRSFTPIRSTIQGVQNDLQTMQSELTGLGVGAGILTGIGMREARSMRNYRIQFTQLVGSEQQANELMGSLTEQANEFGINVTEVFQLGRSLIPVLEDGEQSLGEWVKRAALLSSTNPLKGTTDAIRAIQEYLAGQERSLQFLFNVDPNLIAEAKSQFQDTGAQLDFILNKMGANEGAAREMASAWTAVTNELRLALAEGFTPLLQQMRPIATHLREFVTTLREANPALLKVGGGLTALVAAGAPSLVMLNQVISALQKIKGLSIAPSLSALGKAGLYGGAVAVGTGLGVGAARGLGRATGNEQMAQTNLKSIITTVRKALVVFADTLSKVYAAIGAQALDGARDFGIAINKMIAAIGDFVTRIGKLLRMERLEGAGKTISKQANQNIEAVDAAFQGLIDGILRVRERYSGGVARALTPEFFDDGRDIGPRTLRDRLSGSIAGGNAGSAGYTDEQLAAIEQWHEEREQIQESTEQEINRITEQYEAQRAQIIADFERQMAREAEDWARQRLRQQRELERQIAEIRESQAQRETEWTQDLHKRIIEMQENANEQLERLQEEHRLSLLDAASRLDARAIAQENRRYQQRRQQIEDGLQERIAEARAAHQERIREARHANAQRIADMREAHQRRRELEAEDRRIRLERMKEDQQRRLDEMEAQKDAEINQLIAQENEKLRQLNIGFRAQLTQLGLYQSSWLKTQEAGQRASLNAFEAWWARMQNTMSQSRGIIGGRQFGGPVTASGPMMLHGSQSQPEYVLDQQTTSMLRSALGGSFTQGQLVGAVAGGRSSTISLQPGAINIPIRTAPGQSAEDVGAAVRSELEQLFRELGR